MRSQSCTVVLRLGQFCSPGTAGWAGGSQFTGLIESKREMLLNLIRCTEQSLLNSPTHTHNKELSGLQMGVFPSLRNRGLGISENKSFHPHLLRAFPSVLSHTQSKSATTILSSLSEGGWEYTGRYKEPTWGWRSRWGVSQVAQW